MNKKIIMGCLGILAVTASFTACKKEDGQEKEDTGYVWTKDGGLDACSRILFSDGKEDSEGKDIGNGNQEFVFTGKQTLAKGTYHLKGWVYIADGAELTIEPGAVVKGDKATMAALVVERGGKLIARGTRNEPIVFTSGQEAGSRKPGDWGGVILCGKARNNQTEMIIEGGPRSKHGGDEDSDNSGVLSYVRIEFAGYPFKTDKEINGLTLGSVGSGTQIDHIQVSYSNDDSIEWFGGCSNAKYLIAWKGWDDDFDTDNGFSGTVQFALAVRDSRIADVSQSNGFESDNCADGAEVTPFTSAVFSNVTFVGPKLDASFVNDADYINGGALYPNNGSALGKFQAAMQIRRNSRLNCINSIAVGYPVGLMLDNQKGDTQGAAQQGLMKIENVWFAGMDVTGSDANKCYEDVLVTGYDENSKPVYDKTQKSFSTTYFLAQKGNRVLDGWDSILSSDGFTPFAGSAVLNAASFEGASSSFTEVSFIGAIGTSENWMDGWTEFDPENAEY
ncbi:MAG: hypothetical protein Q4B16_03910 [Bacteroidia bacterium]|nr:hypothetical protein [Bacteroidia bacterium]